MTAITEAQSKRLRDIRSAILLGRDLASPGTLEPKFHTGDVKMIVERIDELDDGSLSCADEIVEFALNRVTEDLRQKQSWLEDALDQVRTAGLMVREAEHALKALSELKKTGLYASGDEINKRWDAAMALYRAQGMLPLPEPVEDAPEEPAQAEEPKPVSAPVPPPEPYVEKVPERIAQPAPAPSVEAAPKPMAQEPRETRWGSKTRNREPISPEEQERLMYDALKSAAGDNPQVQVSIAVLSAKSGVPNGSTLTVLRRLADAKRIEIISDKPEKGTPHPNIYRFIEATENASPPDHPPANRLIPAEEAAQKLSEA